jgi:hypothetical protein
MELRVAQIESDEDQIVHAYVTHVASYTSRSLIHESDILHAFEGLMSHLSNISTEGLMFFWGLPAQYLPYALAWRRTASAEALQRRRTPAKY